MSISVKDIQEKEFSVSNTEGYNIDEVDDFLDELAKQLSGMYRDAAQKDSAIAALKAQLADAQAELDEIKNAPVDDTPKDGEYFENLKKFVREAQLSAIRLKDETVAGAKEQAAQILDGAKSEAETALSSAKEEAEKLLGSAREESEKLLGDAREESEKLTAKNESLRASIEEYRENFRKMIEAQAATLEQ